MRTLLTLTALAVGAVLRSGVALGETNVTPAAALLLKACERMVVESTDPKTQTKYVLTAAVVGRELLAPQDLKSGKTPYRVTVSLDAMKKGQRFASRCEGTAAIYVLKDGEVLEQKQISLAKMCPT